MIQWPFDIFCSYHWLPMIEMLQVVIIYNDNHYKRDSNHLVGENDYGGRGVVQPISSSSKAHCTLDLQCSTSWMPFLFLEGLHVYHVFSGFKTVLQVGFVHFIIFTFCTHSLAPISFPSQATFRAHHAPGAGTPGGRASAGTWRGRLDQEL